MSYKITLKNPSQLKFVCGLAIPNGFCHVMEMDFDNRQQFENLKRAPGTAEVSIEKSTLEPGCYTVDGRKVDYASLKDWCWTNGGSPIKYLDEAKPKVEVKAETTVDQDIETETDELTMLKSMLDEKGIKYRKNATKESLEKLATA